MEQKNDVEINELLNKIYDTSLPVLSKIAPDGWANSEYVRFLHPTAQQQYEEQKTVAENLKDLQKLTGKQGEEIEEPDINSLKQDDLDNIPELDEFRYIMGIAVYDIFSNNHEVYGDDERVYDLGSARGSGDTIADFLNTKFDYSPAKYDYLDFYIGAILLRERANLLPFYEHVFFVLRDEGCDWNYSFPRLYLVDFGKNNAEKDDDNMADYKPEEALANELQENEGQKEVDEVRRKLDASFAEEYEEAKYKPLPAVVQAYKNVYGVLPAGHPQKEFE